MWLDAAAAASLNRWEAAKGKLNLTDAGRTEGEQQGLINRWYAGGTYNRPPYLYKPYEPAAQGPHVGGHAIDTDQIERAKREGQFYGWFQDVPSDPVHFVYHEDRDQSKGAPPVPVATGLWSGIQKMLKAKYGYTGAIDNLPGNGTWSAMQRFLKANWGYTGIIDGVASVGGPTWKATQRWLQARYGYRGAIDGIPGPQTNAALQAASNANGAAF
jgi:hypothetical protein